MKEGKGVQLLQIANVTSLKIRFANVTSLNATIAAKVALEASITAMSDNGGEEVEATAEGQLVQETLQEDHDNSPEGSGEASHDDEGASSRPCSPADVAELANEKNKKLQEDTKVA